MPSITQPKKQATKLETKLQASEPEPVLTKKRRKQNKTHFPTITNDYCTLHLNRIPQATNCQVNQSHRQVG